MFDSTYKALLKISNIKINNTDILAYLDVTSLFTNVFIKEGIDIIAKKKKSKIGIIMNLNLH